MKTKILAMLFLVLTIVFIVTACGDSNNNNGNNSNEHIHSWIEATCMSPKTCDFCGQTQGTVVAHSWSEATCSSPKICDFCGIETGTISDDNHSFGEWEIFSELSCTTDDFKQRTCTLCSFTEEEQIKATGHNFISGICEHCGTNGEKTAVRDIVYRNSATYKEYWIGILNESKELTSADIELSVQIISNTETVYSKIFNVTKDDFQEYTRSDGTVELLAKFTIDRNEIKYGANEKGTIQIDVKGTGNTDLEPYSQSGDIILSKTPYAEFTSSYYSLMYYEDSDFWASAKVDDLNATVSIDSETTCSIQLTLKGTMNSVDSMTNRWYVNYSVFIYDGYSGELLRSETYLKSSYYYEGDDIAIYKTFSNIPYCESYIIRIV